MTAARDPVLLADIGGTHARFATLYPGQTVPADIRVLPTRDHPSPAAAIRAYLEMVDLARPWAATLAIAGPTTPDGGTLTNHAWAFPTAALKRELALDRLSLLNDFHALSLALPYLSADDLRQVGSGAPVSEAPKAVIGPGTGLGVASTVYTGRVWQAIDGEGGHVTYGGRTEAEDRLIALLRARFDHVSGERMVSGDGLRNLHGALRSLAGLPETTLSPKQILAHALDRSCPHCESAVAHFCAILGTLGGNLALTLGARGGLYIAGGIVPRMGGAFDRSPFRERFLDHGRFRDYLEAIPTFVITAPHAGLLGAGRHYLQTCVDTADSIRPDPV
jgi:glucokinase